MRRGDRNVPGIALLSAVLVGLTTGLLMGARPAWAAAPPLPPVGAAGFRYLDSLRRDVGFPGRGSLTTWTVPAKALERRARGHEVGPPPGDLAARADVISTVDTAWVALAYLKAWEVEKLPGARDQARKALLTLVALQRPDGTFPAYLCPEVQRTPFGERSIEDDWMATARATQAMGAALRLGGVGDRGFTKELEQALTRVFQRVGAFWSTPGHAVGAREQVEGQSVPAWLPAHRCDVAAGLVLGLLDWHESAKVPEARETARRLCEGIVDMQRGDPDTFPWGAFMPRTDRLSLWYGDGALQVAAVARAAAIFSRPTWMSAASREGDGLLPHVLVFYHCLGQFAPNPDLGLQPSSTAACLAVGAAELYRATGKDRFAILAGLAASWFGGSNGHPGPLDRTTGRCADFVGPDGPCAEASPATVAAVAYALLDVESTYGRRYLGVHSTRYRVEPLVLEATDGRPVGAPFVIEDLRLPGVPQRVARLGHDNALWLRFQVSQPAMYRVDLVYLREEDSGTTLSVRLDGDSILRVPLEGGAGGAALLRRPAVVAARLEAGPHIVAARGDGVLLSRKSALAGFVIQPVTGWRVWETPGGYVSLVKNTSESPQAVDLPPALHLAGGGRHHLSAWDASGTSVSLNEQRLGDGSVRIVLPAHAYGIVEWQGREGPLRRESGPSSLNRRIMVTGR